MLSQTVEYALRATLYIARQAPRPVRMIEVAHSIEAPPKYLAKILGQLARDGVLDSTRGAAGGFRLSNGAARLTLSHIVAVFDGQQPQRCLLGHGVCGQNPACHVHQRWSPIAKTMSDFFGQTTVAELISPRSSF